jgi:hypothetical protein
VRPDRSRLNTDKQADLFDLFGDPHRSIVDQTLHAYEYPDKWVNRLILGDSLVVMNSLLHYEGLGGQVQMIYIDPPYGVKFGSNVQPFVRKRDVSHGDDEDLTREPEMVKAYRDTWELGLHSYLTYMRDRLLLARDLLTQSGSALVQISDENLHHVRELMDEVFGAENFIGLVAFVTTTSQTSVVIQSVAICFGIRGIARRCVIDKSTVLDAGGGLQRPLLPRIAGVLPSHGGVERSAESAQGRLRRHRLGSSRRHAQRAVRSGRRNQIAVKVIDDRGNELLVVKALV